MTKNIYDNTIINDDKPFQVAIEELSDHPQYSNHMPGWYNDYNNFYSNGLTLTWLFPKLQSKAPLNLYQSNSMLNPSWFKKQFYFQQSLDVFIEELGQEFNRVEQGLTKSWYQGFVQNHLLSLTNQLTDAKAKGIDMNSPSLSLLKTEKQLAENCLTNDFLLDDAYIRVLNSIKQLKTHALDRDSGIYELVTSDDLLESRNFIDENINLGWQLSHNHNIKRDKTKVLIIDGFLENDGIEKTTFNNPALDNLVLSTSWSMKYEATGHSCHVAGIVKDYSLNCAEFDCADKDNLTSWTKFPYAQVVNMSIGLSDQVVPNFLELCKGRIIVKTLDNYSSDISGTFWMQQLAQHPELHQNVILVASHADKGFISPFSNIPGLDKLVQKLTVSAPGNMVQSTVPIVNEQKFAELCPGSEYTDCGISELGGTSMAAPMVSGLAAFLIRKFPELKNAEIVKIIRETCVPTDHPELFGNGYVNFQGALDKANEIHAELVGDQQIDEEF